MGWEWLIGGMKGGGEVARVFRGVVAGCAVDLVGLSLANVKFLVFFFFPLKKSLVH